VCGKPNAGQIYQADKVAESGVHRILVEPACFPLLWLPDALMVRPMYRGERQHLGQLGRVLRPAAAFDGYHVQSLD